MRVRPDQDISLLVMTLVSVTSLTAACGQSSPAPSGEPGGGGGNAKSSTNATSGGGGAGGGSRSSSETIDAGSSGDVDGSPDSGRGGDGECVIASDCPGESTECSEKLCTSGTCARAAVALGSPCTGGGHVCDGLGQCVECNVGSDCASRICHANACVAPACPDGVKNGTETGLDCGGDGCPPCPEGGSCQKNDDCASTLCRSGACVACNGHEDCAPAGGYCEAGVCTRRLNNGEPCTAPLMCDSSQCVDGVCCDTACDGSCVSCVSSKTASASGTCAPVTKGSDPDNECQADSVETCGSSGSGCNGDIEAPGCILYPSGTACQPASCTAAKATSASTCDGKGQCVSGTTVDCGGYTCDSSGIACLNACSAQSHCAAGFYCSVQGSCEPLKGKGDACAQPEACGALTCVDGVCCDSACTGTCVSCSIPGSVGACTPYAAGTDPEHECAVGICDGSVGCTAGTPKWIRGFGSPYADSVSGLATDSQGNIIMVGSFGGTVDFGGGSVGSAGALDAFVVKLDAKGKTIWQKTFGGASYDNAYSVAVGPNDEIVVSGRINGRVDLGGGPVGANSGYSPFLLKLAQDGHHLKSRSFSAASVTLRVAAVNAAGQIAVGGTCDAASTTTVDLGGGILPNPPGSGYYDTWLTIATYDDSLQHLSSRLLRSGSYAAVTGVASSPLGTFVFTGWGSGDVDFGGGTLKLSAGHQPWIADLFANGAHAYSTTFTPTILAPPSAIAISPEGDIAITGEYRGTVDFGGGSLPSTTSSPFVAVFDASHRHRFSKGFSSSESWVKSGSAIAFAPGGGVVVAGQFTGSLNLGGSTFNAASPYGLFLVRYNSSGIHLWSDQGAALTSFSGIVGLVLSGGTTPIVAGTYQSTVNFGGPTVSGFGDTDLFLAGFAP